MALLKAFVCQVLLLGLYKLFLEKVVEEHLVPDELTRNCLVGFVCLLCFGIQLYTDKADDDETEEDPKVKSATRGSTGDQRFELTDVSLTEDAVRKIIPSKESCPSYNTETTSQKEATRKKQSSEDQQEVNRAETRKIPSLISNGGNISEFSTNIPKTTGVAASTYKDVFEQNSRSPPELNGTSEASICEESDDESIEIDQFVPKEVAEVDEKSIMHKVEAIKVGQDTRASLDSECLTSNGITTSSTQELGSSVNGSETESNIISDKVEESSKIINEMSSNATEEIPRSEESRKLLTEENEVGDKVDESSKDASESNEYAKDSIPCFQERYCPSSTSTSPKVELNTPNKSNEKTSTTLISRRKSLTQNVVITSVNIDISFLYAFY